jgi:hypothetical protein
MTEDMPIETILGADPEGTVDAEVVKITKEKRSVPDSFDDVGGVLGRTSSDGD